MAEETATAETAEKTTTVTDLQDLATATESEAAPVREPKKDEFGRSYATGRRKDAVARVWIKAGNGKVEVNKKDYKTYFGRATQQMIIEQAFKLVDRDAQFDVYATVSGGGLSGQAGAIRHGIAQALTLFEPELRPTLKQAGLLTRDSRAVERKKYGRRKARRGMQWAKR